MENTNVSQAIEQLICEVNLHWFNKISEFWQEFSLGRRVDSFYFCKQINCK